MIVETCFAAEHLPMQTRYGIAIAAFILTILPIVSFAQRPVAPGDRFPGTSTLWSPPGTHVSPNLDDAAEYGLSPGQAIPEIEVKLKAKRQATLADRNDVVGRAGDVIATARTGPAGGVTFAGISPGSYVVVFKIARWAAPAAELDSKITLPRRPIVKYRSGYEWREFADTRFQYAIRAPNLVFKAEELRRSSDAIVDLVFLIAQEFEITGSEPVAVRAAIGYSTPVR